MLERRRRIAVLGSTGSIGRQAVDVIRSHPDVFEAVGLTAHSNRELLADHARALGVARWELGEKAAVDLAAADEVDVVLNAIVGAAGLAASIAALESGKVLALANKESLVAGGEACLDAMRRGGGEIVPVDSEHAALRQCLQGRDRGEVARVVLTASGGPLRTRRDLSGVTVEDALAHPTWSMGRKISVDSATLMNKGLEVIEAHFLFDLDIDRIKVVVHPQSTVHGVVELVDGSTIMQAAPTDMRIPIAAALAAPSLLPGEIAPVALEDIGRLEFERVDDARFPSLRLAYEAGRRGASFPAALNAANEEAVTAFLEERIGFNSIPEVVEEVLADHDPAEVGDLAAVLAVDRRARADARRRIEAASSAA